MAASPEKQAAPQTTQVADAPSHMSNRVEEHAFQKIPKNSVRNAVQ